MGQATKDRNESLVRVVKDFMARSTCIYIDSALSRAVPVGSSGVNCVWFYNRYFSVAYMYYTASFLA